MTHATIREGLEAQNGTRGRTVEAKSYQVNGKSDDHRILGYLVFKPGSNREVHLQTVKIWSPVWISIAFVLTFPLFHIPTMVMVMVQPKQPSVQPVEHLPTTIQEKSKPCGIGYRAFFQVQTI